MQPTLSAGFAMIRAGEARGSRHGAGGVWGYFSSIPRAEGWRVWVSFMFLGIYGVIAGRYLATREEWMAGLVERQWPPVPPSLRASVIVTLSFAMPLTLVAFATLFLGLQEVQLVMSAAGEAAWSNTHLARVGLWLNIPVAAWLICAAILSQSVDARIAGVVEEIGGGDPLVAERYATGSGAKRLAVVVSALPAALLSVAVGIALTQVWLAQLSWLIAAYGIATVVASWAVSWLNISPLLRMRATLLQVMY